MNKTQGKAGETKQKGEWVNTDLKKKVRKTEKSRIYWWGGARGGREGKHKAIQKVNSKEENKIALYPKDK